MNKILKKNLIILLLILILCLLLIIIFCMIKIRNNNYFPTGNIDVFDIDIRCKYIDNFKCMSSNKTNEEGTIPVFNEKDDENILGIVFVDDINGNYLYQQNLKIFTNSAFKNENIIAPGVSNTYNFIVHNSTNTDLRYYIKMYEITEYKINLKYRLKKNNKYIIGDDSLWVSTDELSTELKKINLQSSDSYSLDWKWFDDDANDTIIGKKMVSDYKLNIRIYFEAV